MFYAKEVNRNSGIIKYYGRIAITQGKSVNYWGMISITQGKSENEWGRLKIYLGRSAIHQGGS